MSAIARLLRILGTRLLPVLVVLLAIFVGWLSQHEQPLGLFFATIFPIFKGQLPSTIFGHGSMTGTPPVPDDMMPLPRPKNELFLELPGGYQMPQAGLGMCCRPSAYDDVLVRRTVLWYLLLGGRHIDAAHLYLNHRAIGQGIQDAIKRGIPREEIFVTTKIFPTFYGYNTTLRVVPTYLEELQLDYIDLVLMHFPAHFPFLTNDCNKQKLTPAECRADTYRALSELRIDPNEDQQDDSNNKKKGILRNIGVSNFAVPHLQQVQSLNLAPVAVNQFQFNPWAPDFVQDTYQYCRTHNISITAYASLGGSLQHSQAATVDGLNAIAQKHAKSVPQVMLRWAIQNHMAVIPGTGNPNHMKENLDVYSFELDAEDMAVIDSLKEDPLAKKFFYMEPPKE